MEITSFDTMADGWKLWSQWQREAWPHNSVEIEALERDAGRFLTYVRLVGTRRLGMALEEYCWPDTMRSMPSSYDKKSMLRD